MPISERHLPQPLQLHNQLNDDAVPLLKAKRGAGFLGKFQFNIAIRDEAVHHELRALRIIAARQGSIMVCGYHNDGAAKAPSSLQSQ